MPVDDIKSRISPAADQPIKAAVWATRPEKQNISWVDRLSELGLEVFDVPLLGIEAVEASADKEKIKQQVLNLDRYKTIIFVSQNAVNQALPWIENYWPQCPIGIDWYAVGSKTARVLSNRLEQLFGVVVDINAADSAMTSETLLDLPGLRNVESSKICIMRGKGGRPKLAEVLAQRGAQVDLCELYERTLPEVAISQLDCILMRYAYENVESDSPCARSTGIKQAKSNELYISLFSGETLDNLVRILDLYEEKANLDNLVDLTVTEVVPKCKVELMVRRLKKDAVCFVPSERVALQASTLGFEKVVCSKNATEHAMLETIKAYAEKEA